MINAEKLLIVVSIGFIASVSPAFARTVEQNAYARFLKEGPAQMKAGDYETARESFEHAIEYRAPSILPSVFPASSELSSDFIPRTCLPELSPTGYYKALTNYFILP